MFDVNSDIRFKTRILKPTLCDYSDAYILVKRRITITGVGADAAARQADERVKENYLKIVLHLINCKTEINNTKIDNAKDINIVMPMYNLIEYSDNDSKMAILRR